MLCHPQRQVYTSQIRARGKYNLPYLSRKGCAKTKEMKTAEDSEKRIERAIDRLFGSPPAPAARYTSVVIFSCLCKFKFSSSSSLILFPLPLSWFQALHSFRVRLYPSSLCFLLVQHLWVSLSTFLASRYHRCWCLRASQQSFYHCFVWQWLFVLALSGCCCKTLVYCGIAPLLAKCFEKQNMLPWFVLLMLSFHFVELQCFQFAICSDGKASKTCQLRYQDLQNILSILSRFRFAHLGSAN